jgi:hypothetical protein
MKSRNVNVVTVVTAIAFCCLMPLAVIGQTVSSQTEEAAWKTAVEQNTAAAYKAFRKSHPESKQIVTKSGTLRCHYWKNMQDDKDRGALVSFKGVASPLKISVSDAFAEKLLGVVKAKPGQQIKTDVKTFDYFFLEFLGPLIEGRTLDDGNGVTEVVSPRDFENATALLSMDGSKLLAWDVSEATVAKEPFLESIYPHELYADQDAKRSNGTPRTQSATMTSTSPE